MNLKLTPLKIIFIYVIAGGLWILLSDELLISTISDPQRLVFLETLVNWFYILATAGMLYMLIRRSLTAVQESEAKFHEEQLHAREELERRVTERTREIERRRKVAEGLRDILHALNSSQPLEAVLDMIVMRSAQVVGASEAAVCRHLSGDESWMIQTLHNFSTDGKKYLKTSRWQQALNQAALAHHPVQIPDLPHIREPSLPSETPRTSSACADHHAGADPSVLAVPIMIQKEVYGGLLLYCPMRRQIPEGEIKLVIILADHAALAIENAHLRAEVQQAAVLAERGRLARDLHDSVTQALYSIMLYAEATNLAMVAGKPDVSAQNLQELRNMAHEAMLDMRMLIFQLHPPALEEEGLSAVLQARLNAVEARAGLETELVVEHERRLSLNIEEELFWIAQETLNNVAKHAKAKKVRVDLHYEDECVSLTVQDDGIGFDMTTPAPGGVGMRGIEERVQHIKGQLNITSSQEHGTTLNVTVTL